jgi:hypothetical protein
MNAAGQFAPISDGVLAVGWDGDLVASALVLAAV